MLTITGYAIEQANTIEMPLPTSQCLVLALIRQHHHFTWTMHREIINPFCTVSVIYMYKHLCWTDKTNRICFISLKSSLLHVSLPNGRSCSSSGREQRLRIHSWVSWACPCRLDHSVKGEENNIYQFSRVGWLSKEISIIPVGWISESQCHILRR